MTSPVAIITAGGRGMGLATAERLAQDGYRVAMMSPSGSARLAAERLGGWGMDGSVSQRADLKAFIEGTMDHFGRVDVLVNNTGHPAKGPLVDLSDEDWSAGFDSYPESASYVTGQSLGVDGGLTQSI